MYIAILEQLSRDHDSPVSYRGWHRISLKAEDTLELAAEDLKKWKGVSGDLYFVQLEEPIQFTTPRDITSACQHLLDPENLGEAGKRCRPESSMEKLGLAGSRDGNQKCVPLVAIYISRSTFPISEDIFAREAIASAAQNRPSPSTGAKSTQLISTQVGERPDAAYNFRPPELAPPPLSIYHPAFARFRREMATPTESLDLTDEELGRASLLIDVSLRHYPSKDMRREALRSVFLLDKQQLWQDRSVNVNDAKMDPEGVLEFYSGFSFAILYTLLGELKNGGGDGECDPSDQAQCEYIKLVSSKQYEHVRQVSCCPVLLLGLSGHVLAVWGAVFADRFFFERLALIYLGPQPPSTFASPTVGRSDIEVGIREVAKLLRTLERCVQDLKSHYSSLGLQPGQSSPIAPTARSRFASTSRLTSRSLSGLPLIPRLSLSLDPSRFIHWNSFTSQGTQYNLVYHRRLTTYMEKTVFFATMTLSSDPNFPATEVVVKFAWRYGETGHRLLAEAGLAPHVHYCCFEESIGLWVIVMDYVQGAVCNRKLTDDEKDSLSSAISILHKNNLVFGDLREPNVIITGRKSKIVLVDFEWCGPCIDIKEGDRVVQHRVCYPTDISMGSGMDWAPGVGRDQVITKEHDTYRLGKM